MKKHHAAFTLIEVLIALMIIAIALAAAIRATNQSIRTTTHVRTTVVAHFAALNILSEIQTGIIPLPTTGDTLQGATVMLGNTWTWSATFSPTSSPAVMRIVVTVQLHHQNITSVTGYYYEAS